MKSFILKINIKKIENKRNNGEIKEVGEKEMRNENQFIYIKTISVHTQNQIFLCLHVCVGNC